MLDKQLKLEVICTKLPGIRFDDRQGSGIKEPVYLGIQFGKEVIGQVPADRRQATFHPEFTVARKPDGSPNFLGPFAQGKPDDRFFYLSWGIKHESGEFEMFRRLKIRLGHLDWPQINHSLKSGKPIIVRLRLTDEKGCPLCATPRSPNISWD
jgi:hypothetical protein